MSFKKILAIKLRSFGDTVLLTAPLAALRRQFPRAEIHVAVTAQWASLLEQHTAIDRIWPYERHREKAWRAKALARLAYQLRLENFDCVVNFHASPSSAMLAYATGAKVRAIHFHGHKDRNRYSTVEIEGKGVLKPIIERDMDTIRAIGVEVAEGRMPKLYLDSEEFIRGEQTMSHLGFEAPIMALGLGASRPTKIWPMDRFASLAISWAMQTGGGVLAISGPEEEPLVELFLQAVDEQLKTLAHSPEEFDRIKSKIKNLPPLPIRHLAAVLRQSNVFVGNDSGPKHLAVSVQTPTVTIIGPEHPFEWHPYSQDLNPYLYNETLTCRKDGLQGLKPWCGIETCIEERHQCMTSIAVEKVLDEAKRVALL